MSWYCFQRPDRSIDEREVGTDESVVEVMGRHGYTVAWPIDMPKEYLADIDPAQLPLVLPLPDGWRVYSRGEQP